MIKARNRKLSMLLVLAMLMTMFVGIGTASAAATFDSSPVQTDKGVNKTLGTVVVEFDTKFMESDTYSLPAEAGQLAGSVVYGEWLTISLADGAEFQGTPNVAKVSDQNLPIGDTMTGLKVTSYDDVALVLGKLSAQDTIELFVCSKTENPLLVSALELAPAENSDATLKLEFKTIDVTKSSGDIVAQFTSPSGGEFPVMTAQTIATIGSGATTVMVKSVKSIGEDGGAIDTIIILENQKGVFEDEEIIEVKLPKGFTWNEDSVDAAFAAGAWGFAGAEFDMDVDDTGRILYVTVDLDEVPNTIDAAGRVNISSATGEFIEIDVDDTAKFGDILVDITSDKDAVDAEDVKIAVYGDYGVEVVEGTSEEVYAGRGEQELGEFYIEENAAGSLTAGRTMYFELPKGVKWQLDDYNYPVIEMESEDGTGIDDVDFSIVSNTSDRKLKVDFMFDNDSGYFSDEAVKLLISDMEVKIEPGFEGPIDITVSGRAGAEGTVTVAECINPITIKAENPTKVEIGAMNQKVADILIIENVEEAIADGEYNQIEIELPRGVYFSSEPKVEVEAGDLEIDDVDVADSAFNNDGKLIITIDVASSDPSTIRISDVYLTVDRTVPEGNVLAKFLGAEIDEDAGRDYDYNDNEFEYDLIGDSGSTAFVTWPTDKSIGSVEIATTITPKTGGYAEFVIGSNIYTVGGTPYVMDVVPYIKDSRSFVPMRYLADMLGAEIEWSEADQTVTFEGYTEAGKITVVLTIGSTSYTVNGETMTMDVAPEIVNDRSFLPARFVAEAFGAQVGWNAGSQTVTIVR